MPVPALVSPGPPLSRGQTTRYARHLLLPDVGETGQRRLLAARVAVVGAGGLGSPVLLYLAAAGVGTITVIDDDVVEVTNLQRQVVHSADDVGRPKVDSAVEAVRALNPDCQVVGLAERVTAASAERLLAGHDLVLDGSDTFDTRYVVDAACTALGVPLVWAAVYRSAAHLTTFWPGAPEGVPAVGLRDLFPHPPPPGSVPACGDAGVLGALVGQVGAMMAGEAIRLITGSGRPLCGRLLYIDAATSTQREIPLAPSGAYVDGLPQGLMAPPAGPPGSGADEGTPLITPTDLADRLAAPSPPTVLDVREAAEVAIGVVPGARHLPVGELTDDPDLRSLGLKPDQELVLVCKAGPRAHLAADVLRREGYQRLSVLEGGMLAWIDQVAPELPRY